MHGAKRTTPKPGGLGVVWEATNVSLSHAAAGLTGPDFLPPFDVAGVGAAQIHLSTDVGELPTGQIGELARFVFLALGDLAAVLVGRRAGRVFAFPWMAQDVARLEIISISGFLQD